jgi:hypothetical protein
MKMKFEQITFDECRSLINEILNYQPSQNYGLTPNEIFGVVEETGIVLEGERIPGWNDFEVGNKDFTIIELLEKSRIELQTEEPIIVISDECFETEKAYKIPTNKLKEFAEETYPELHNMDLVQPFDLIFIQPSTKTISMIHHEGIIMEY